MSLEIYPADFRTRYEINKAISIMMSVHYNDIGKLQITATTSDYNITALKSGNYVYDTEREAMYIIVSTKFDTNNSRIIANGYTVDWLLNKRCIARKHNISTIESDCYAVINENLRGLPRISTAPIKGYTEKFRTDDSGTSEDESALFGFQLMDEIQSVLDFGEFGRRMVWIPAEYRWVFEIYKGRDLTNGIHRVAFVEEQGTCSNLVIDNDISTFKNVAYTSYIYGDNEHVIEVGSASASERSEIWLASTVISEDGETQESTEKRCIANAIMELGRYINRQSFAVTIDADELGTRFNLGDIVSCVSNRFDVAFNARITGIKYKLDAVGERTEIILGDPILTALGELKLNGH